MKRFRVAACFAPLLVCWLHFAAGAQSSNLLVLSKNANGPIFNTSLTLTLSANADCDQTQSLIPEASRLVSDNFSLSLNSHGVGVFNGFARIVTADGRVIVQGNLRGTAGINTRCGASKDCRLAGHLEGIFESLPSAGARAISRSVTELRSQVLLLNFSADLNREAAGPLPVYRARLDGLISVPSPVAEKVKVVADKSQYAPTDMITATILNEADKPIQALDLKSYCTIVQLQVQDANRWVDLLNCPLSRAPEAVNIWPNQKLEVALKPSQQTPGPNPPGLYRLALTFKVVENGNPVGESLLVASEPFRVVAPPSVEKVSVTTERSSYDVSEPVAIKIVNANDRKVLAPDQKTHCSIVYVQRQEAGGWVDVAPCPSMRPTRLLVINARQELLLKLPPEDGGVRFAPGTYRVQLTYYLADEGGNPIGSPIASYSPQFTITSK